MPADKLIDSVQLDGALTATANAIRAKTGQEENLIWNMTTGFSVAINQIPTISEETENDTATAADLLLGKTAHSKGIQITGTIPTKTSTDLTVSGKTVTVPSGYYAVAAEKSIATGSAKTPATTITQNPTIEIDENGKITASYSGSKSITPTVISGYVSSGTAGAVSVSGSSSFQMDTIPGQTITPSTQNQTLPELSFTLGTQTILGDANLEASKIKSGVSIFGVSGTFTKSGTQSSGSIASASAIRTGYTAWANGAEVKGSLPDRTINQTVTTVSGSSATRGYAYWLSGYVQSGEIGPAVFSNSAEEGVTYVDISSTTDAPVLISGGYLYINQGYTDNLKISLARLVPDAASVGASVTSANILSGTTAYNNEGKIVSGSITNLQASDITINNNVISVGTQKYTGTTAITKTIPSASFSLSVTDQGVATVPSVTPKTQGTITSICVSSAPSGTNGTDYWTIEPSGTASSGTAKAKARISVSTGGYIAGGTVDEQSSTSWTVTPNVNPGSALYLKKATISGSVSNASCTVTVAPGNVTVERVSLPGGVTDASSGSEQTIVPTEGVYVAVRANASANQAGTTASISGSGTASVTSAGYAPKTLTGAISVSGTATAKTSQKYSSITYVPIKMAAPSISGGTVSGTPTFSGTNFGHSETNTSGITITANCQMTRSQVTCSTSSPGWVSGTINQLAENTYSALPKSIYLTSVTLTTNKEFTIRTAAGNFTFTDVGGNVTVKGS